MSNDTNSYLQQFNLTIPEGIKSTLTSDTIETLNNAQPTEDFGAIPDRVFEGVPEIPNTLFVEYIGINTSPGGVLDNPLSTGSVHFFVHGESYFDENVEINSTLNVSGPTTLGSTLDVVGVTSLSSDLYVVGSTTLGSTLNVVGVTSLSSDLFVSGVATVTSLDVVGVTSLSSDLFVSGVATVTSLDVVGVTSLSSTLNVTGATTINSTLDVVGVTSLSSDLYVSNDLTVGIDTSTGLILTSPNGTKYRLIVDNVGILTTVVV